MKIVIADDEPLARQRMRRLVASLSEAHDICAEAADGIEAIAMCEQHQPDVVLLDIRMPRLDGLQAAQKLGELPKAPAVLFVTAYDEHALAAFDAQAMDYLLKPVRLERLQQALGKIQRLAPSAPMASEDVDPALTRSHVCAHTPSGLHRIAVDQVRLFMADQKYVRVETDQGQWLIDDPLKDLEQVFGDRFLRVHRNALVAVAYVQQLVRQADGHYGVSMEGVETVVMVSRRHLSHVRQALRQTG